uniref:Uncharacterized protein n=1 Tax=Timema monikensis TaxID=170555 RepID=A0A7R9ECE7_9NEOP|nr:unnamed protein product [Timema monikensis]
MYPPRHGVAEGIEAEKVREDSMGREDGPASAFTIKNKMASNYTILDTARRHSYTRNNTIDVEGLTDHKNVSDEIDENVNDDILLPLLKECKNKEGNQTIHKCVQGYQTFKCVMNAFDMSSSDASEFQCSLNVLSAHQMSDPVRITERAPVPITAPELEEGCGISSFNNAIYTSP